MNHTNTSRTILLCADDYALHPLVDDAVRQLTLAARLSATSCMTTAPRWREAARACARGHGGPAPLRWPTGSRGGHAESGPAPAAGQRPQQQAGHGARAVQARSWSGTVAGLLHCSIGFPSLGYAESCTSLKKTTHWRPVHFWRRPPCEEFLLTTPRLAFFWPFC